MPEPRPAGASSADDFASVGPLDRSSSGGTGAGSGFGVGSGRGHGSGFGVGSGVGVGSGRSVAAGVGRRRGGPRARSCLAAARRVLRGVHRVTDVLRFLRRTRHPCAMPAATPETFSTGFAITVETARTAVSALSAIETALSVTVSSLSSW